MHSRCVAGGPVQAVGGPAGLLYCPGQGAHHCGGPRQVRYLCIYLPVPSSTYSVLSSAVFRIRIITYLLCSELGIF